MGALNHITFRHLSSRPVLRVTFVYPVSLSRVSCLPVLILKRLAPRPKGLNVCLVSLDGPPPRSLRLGWIFPALGVGPYQEQSLRWFAATAVRNLEYLTACCHVERVSVVKVETPSSLRSGPSSSVVF